MIVVDASAWVDIARDVATDSLRSAMAQDGHWVVPEHFRIEALNASRGALLGGRIDELAFARGARDLADAPLDVWPTPPLVPRIVQLARNASTYDAAYVALAEELGCRLVAPDSKFSRIPGIRCQVIGFA